MEHLTKSQIVLLTLFVSFVASMATGIVVVTLMQQSPEPVTQTITNVVERTIEKIAPAQFQPEKLAKTIIVKDEDLMVAAIDRNIKSVVAFKTIGQDGEPHTAGVGVIVSPEGLVITDKGNFGAGILTTTIDGVAYALQVLSNENSNTLGIGRLTPVTATTTPTFTAVTFGNPDALKLGQTAIVIGGRDGRTIVTGLVSNLDTYTKTDKDTKVETKVLSNVGISLRLPGTSNGAPIINLDGGVIGFLSIDENAGVQIGVPTTEAQRIITAVSQVKKN